jgi:hypothetical protein
MVVPGGFEPGFFNISPVNDEPQESSFEYGRNIRKGKTISNMIGVGIPNHHGIGELTRIPLIMNCIGVISAERTTILLLNPTT